MNKAELNLLVLCQRMPDSIGLKEAACSMHCAGHLLPAHSVKAANSEESFTSTLDQTRRSLQGKQILFFIFLLFLFFANFTLSRRDTPWKS